MAHEPNVQLYVCELLYEDQGQTQFYVTEKTNPIHLQIKAKTPLWHKENMIGIEFDSSTKLLVGFKLGSASCAPGSSLCWHKTPTPR